VCGAGQASLHHGSINLVKGTHHDDINSEFRHSNHNYPVDESDGGQDGDHNKPEP